MSKVLTLARRELSAYFYSPLAYLIAAAFLGLVALVFFLGVNITFLRVELPAGFRSGGEATLKPVFDVLAYALVVIIPLLTMRLVAEEFRSGTIETLMTAPVTDAEVIGGKFLGTFILYLAMLAATGVFFLLLAIFGQPDYGRELTAYLGIILLGAAYISVGIFASTLTAHQLVAGLIGIGILGFFTGGINRLAQEVRPELALTVDKFNIVNYFGGFSRGVFDVRGAVFFLSVTAFFLFMSTKMLESRRWR